MKTGKFIDSAGIDRSYRYENRAAELPPISQVANPQEGDRARTAIGCIVVFRQGNWFYD